MPEPTNREIMIHLQDMKETITEIKQQTMKTNGRVSWLEKTAYLIIGAITILSWLVGTNLLNLTRIS